MILLQPRDTVKDWHVLMEWEESGSHFMKRSTRASRPMQITAVHSVPLIRRQGIANGSSPSPA